MLKSIGVLLLMAIPLTIHGQQLKDLNGSPQFNEDVYKLSSEIFGDLTTSTIGDVEEMKRVIINAQRDPEGFYKRLSPEQKRQIQELSTHIRAPSASP